MKITLDTLWNYVYVYWRADSWLHVNDKLKDHDESPYITSSAKERAEETWKVMRSFLEEPKRPLLVT
ncbi:uncharacterized protein ARMOST_04421 [Armillaria ostoyae]|uniref:Uncharacterized protein n=1 Tax=Armillaria ostoyae TaxID=47428 RepID=A0A284QXF3_ARMOS|nr:uncharacterized protein ARMOST_04421 [Armillaria ostoyae]